MWISNVFFLKTNILSHILSLDIIFPLAAVNWWYSCISLSLSENQVSDSDDTDAQTTSSHPESGDAIVCSDETVILETNDG